MKTLLKPIVLVLLSGLVQPLFSGGERQSVLPADPVLLSQSGSSRATAYLETPKIISFDGKTHVAWLGSTPGGFRVYIRSLDHETGKWSPARVIGEAPTNHGGPALTIDAEGFLHVVYYSHHHPFRYRRSVRPNDSSEWMPYTTFGTDLTYPALVCAADGTLILTARRSYEDRPWELEMWSKPPGAQWRQAGTVLASRYTGYAQFAASLAWGPDHRTLHLASRIYEMPADPAHSPITSVGYLKSHDNGKTWERRDGSTVPLPATAGTMDIIATGKGREGRVLNAGSIGVDSSGTPHIPYNIRTQDSSQAYLATPWDKSSWRHRHLNPFLPEPYRDWDLFMHGGIAFGSAGTLLLTGTIMQVEADGIDWGHPTTEGVYFLSAGDGGSFTAGLFRPPDPSVPCWMPNMERPTGFNEMPPVPAFIYTVGQRGSNLEEQVQNQVWYQAWEDGTTHDSP